MRPAASIAILLALTFLAGCLGGDGETPNEPTAETEGEASAEAGTSAESPPAPPAPTVKTESFDEEGNAPTGAWVMGISPAYSSFGDRWFPVELDGTVTGAELTMEWEAESPGTESMMLAFGILEEDGGAQWSEEYERVAGPSPLTLQVDDLDWDEEEYVIFVWVDSSQPVAASVGQPFQVSGTFTTVA